MKNQRGNILIESIVSISLILVGLLAVLGLVTSSIRETKNISLKETATYLAAEGIEVTKNLIDTDVASQYRSWNNILTSTGRTTNSLSLQYDSIFDTNSNIYTDVIFLGGVESSQKLTRNESTGFYHYDTSALDVQTLFSRTVYISRGATDDELIVRSVVKWTDQGIVQKVTLEDIFTNWRSDSPSASVSLLFNKPISYND